MNNLFVSTAYAQATTAVPGQAAPSPLMSFLPFVLIFVVFYFLIIRPQKKKVQEEQKMINELKKGDEVYTKTGIIGTIASLTEKIITLEVSEGVKIKVLRGQVAGLFKNVPATVSN